MLHTRGEHSMVLYSILLPLAILSLFMLFVLAKHDFLFLRRNITLVFVFNTIFISLGFGFVIGRLFYVLDTHSFALLFPIVFFHVIKYLGFSLYGGFIGSSVVVLLLTFRKKIALRTLDIVSLSLFPMLFWYVFALRVEKISMVVRLGIFFILLFLSIALFKSYRNYFLKDGSIFLVVGIIFSVFNFFSVLYDFHKGIFASFSFSQIVSMLFVVISLFLLMSKEGVIFKIKIQNIFPKL